MEPQLIPLNADLQRRILIALRANKFNLVDFPELRMAQPGQRLIINSEDFTSEEIDQLASLKGVIPFRTETGQVSLTKATKIALLRACQQGHLNPDEVLELIRAQKALRRDFSAVPNDQLRLLAKASRLRKNDLTQ